MSSQARAGQLAARVLAGAQAAHFASLPRLTTAAGTVGASATTTTTAACGGASLLREIGFTNAFLARGFAAKAGRAVAFRAGANATFLTTTSLTSNSANAYANAGRGFASSSAKKEKENGGGKNENVDRTKELMRGAELTELHYTIANEEREVMPYKEFIKIVQPYVKHSEDVDADGLAKTLHRASVVIIYNDEVFTKPKDVALTIAAALPPPNADSDGDGVSDYDEIIKTKEEAETSAKRVSNLVLWTGFGLLTLQLTCFFRATFWELSWDVMEPLTYFVGGAQVMAAYLYYLFTREDFSFSGTSSLLERYIRDKKFKSRGIDAKKIEAFNAAVALEEKRRVARAAAKAVRLVR